MVGLSDRLCDVYQLGYGMDSVPGWKLEDDPSWAILTRSYPSLATTDVAHFLSDMEQFVAEARKLVRSILRS